MSVNAYGRPTHSRQSRALATAPFTVVFPVSGNLRCFPDWFADDYVHRQSRIKSPRSQDPGDFFRLFTSQVARSSHRNRTSPVDNAVPQMITRPHPTIHGVMVSFRNNAP